MQLFFYKKYTTKGSCHWSRKARAGRFFISYKDEQGNWGIAQNMGKPINTENNEGAPSLSADGRNLFFAACQEYDGYGNGRQGFGSCDIFIQVKQMANGRCQKMLVRQ